MTLSTASLPGSSILRETRSNCGNHLPVNETRPRRSRGSAVLREESQSDQYGLTPHAPEGACDNDYAARYFGPIR
jgi:hypothetical protein